MIAVQSALFVVAMSSNSSDYKRPCPLCDGLRKKELFKETDFLLVRCLDCGMVYLANEISYDRQLHDHDFADTFYQERARRHRRHPFLVFWTRQTLRFRPQSNDRMLRQTLRWAKSGRLVDFGCGGGSFLARARGVFEVFGVEISPRIAEIARVNASGASIFVGPVTDVPYPESTFDVVTQFGVLEHEWHPRSALNKARALLKPGGVTVLKVPNYGSWNRSIRGREWCGYRFPDHCNYFTSHSLAAMLRRCGFELLRGSFRDRLPTSDSLWMAARKPA